MVAMNLKVNEYTSRVLGVIKERYGLKDKAEALDKFADEFGEEYVDREIKDEIVKEVVEISKRHKKKYGNKTMSIKELDALFRGEKRNVK